MVSFEIKRANCSLTYVGDQDCGLVLQVRPEVRTTYLRHGCKYQQTHEQELDHRRAVACLRHASFVGVSRSVLEVLRASPSSGLRIISDDHHKNEVSLTDPNVVF